MNFLPNQIIRNLPLPNGSFSIFMVKGHVLDMVEVREIDRSTGKEMLCETEFWHSHEIELYSFTSNLGTISIGQYVRCFGLEGDFVVQRFFEQDDMIMAVVRNQKGHDQVWHAHYVK